MKLDLEKLIEECGGDCNEDDLIDYVLYDGDCYDWDSYILRDSMNRLRDYFGCDENELEIELNSWYEYNLFYGEEMFPVDFESLGIKNLIDSDKVYRYLKRIILKNSKEYRRHRR